MLLTITSNYCYCIIVKARVTARIIITNKHLYYSLPFLVLAFILFTLSLT